MGRHIPDPLESCSRMHQVDSLADPGSPPTGPTLTGSLPCWATLLTQCFHICGSNPDLYIGEIVLTSIYSGQGAAVAFEDAAVLGTLFSKIQRKSQLPYILSIYERLRKPRTTALRSRSQAMRDVYAFDDGPLQQERDRQLQHHAPSDGYCCQTTPTRDWLFRHSGHLLHTIHA